MERKKQSWVIFFILSVAELAVINSVQNTSSYLIPCEEGWFLFGDKCYKAFDISQSVTWNTANLSCAVLNGSLVTIQSQELQDFLTSFFLLDVKTNLWIGLNDIESELNYTWADGSNVNYTSWFSNEPSNGRGFYGLDKDCVAMNYGPWGMGKWQDIQCITKRPFICQTNKSDRSKTHDPRFCTGENDGAWKYQNSCYRNVKEEMSWDDAENYCQTLVNGHLLAIMGPDEERFIRGVLFPDFNREIWIGIKIHDAGKLTWSSDWSVNYQNWDNYRSHSVNGTCAYMTEKQFWKSWLAAPCFQKRPFICEVPHVKPPPLKQAPEGWRCPELSQDWIDLGGDTCYIFETYTRREWHEANFICLKKGGHLASIHSAAEAYAIQRHIKGGPEAMLIGLHRSLSNKSVFEWVDGSPLDYQSWKLFGPRSGSTDQACGAIWTDDMKWGDASCDYGREYICSAKKVPSFPQGSNESAVTDSELPMEKNCSVTPFHNETTSTDSPLPVETNCSVVIALLVAVIILFVVGCTIDVCKNHCRKNNNQRCKNFGMLFSAKDRTGSKELVGDDTVLRI